MIRDFTSIADLPAPVPWTVHGSQSLYDSRWVSLELVDVEPTHGARYEHHVVIVPYAAVCVVVQHPQKGVLLLYRHRFITDTAGFELPAGGIDEGESVLEAAAREVREETGWAVDHREHMMTLNASDGVSTQKFHFVYARASHVVEEPSDAYESDQLYWVSIDDISTLIRSGKIPGCPTMTGLLYALQTGLLERETPTAPYP